jgi:hypothetical protein
MMSLTTCLLNVAGNTTRIFTTLVLTKDMYILSACTTQVQGLHEHSQRMHDTGTGFA